MTTLAFVAGILLGGKRACFSPSMFGAWAMPWQVEPTREIRLTHPERCPALAGPEGAGVARERKDTGSSNVIQH